MGCLVLLAAAFLGLGWRCFYLQYYRNDYYRQRCDVQQLSRSARCPRRGAIFDCWGNVLAASNPDPIVKADPKIIRDPEAVATRLAPIVEMDPGEIYWMIVSNRHKRFVKVKTGLDPNACAAASRIYGVGVDMAWLRHYPMGRLTSSVVGFTSRDGRAGLEGLELKYDAQLRGSGGYSTLVRDVARRPIRLKDKPVPVEDGRSLVLTLDTTIQQYARDALSKQLEKYQAEAGFVVVAEPRTGRILSLVSLPDFDPLETGRTDPNNFRIRPVSDSFEPGSIIKPIVMAIALDAGVVGKNETIFCENGHYSGRGFGSISEYKTGYGNLTTCQILVKSSNIGMAKVGQRLGKERLYEGLRRFGFGKKTGIELPGEIDGTLWPVRVWTSYSITRIPFGQELCVTGMQLVRAFCILANGGRLVKPYLVSAIIEPDGQLRRLRRPAPAVGYIVKPDVARWTIDAMAAVVNQGTGKRAKLEKWQVFGKTGTANIALEDGPGYSKDHYVASFVCGAPAENPAVIVLVSIRKPNKRLGIGYTGGVVAAPVAAEIIEKTLNYLEKLKGYYGV